MNKKLIGVIIAGVFTMTALPAVTSSASKINTNKGITNTSKAAVYRGVTTNTSAGAIKVTSLYPTNVYNGRSLQSSIVTTIPGGTSFEVHKSGADGWYYGAFGNDYQGWTWGWVQSSAFGSSYGAIKVSSLFTTNVYSGKSVQDSVDYTIPGGTSFEVHESDADGWYYGAFGNDYQGWHWGWVKSSDFGSAVIY